MYWEVKPARAFFMGAAVVMVVTGLLDFFCVFRQESALRELSHGWIRKSQVEGTQRALLADANPLSEILLSHYGTAEDKNLVEAHFLKQASELLLQLKMDMYTFTAVPAERDGEHPEIHFHLETGGTYGQAVQLLNALENGPLFTRVTAMQLVENPRKGPASPLSLILDLRLPLLGGIP